VVGRENEIGPAVAVEVGGLDVHGVGPGADELGRECEARVADEDAGAVVQEQFVLAAVERAEDEVGPAVAVDVHKVAGDEGLAAGELEVGGEARGVFGEEAAAVVEVEARSERAGGDVAQVDVEIAVAVDVGDGDVVRELHPGGEAGGILDEAAVGRGEQETGLLAGKRREIVTVASEENIGAAVAVEIADELVARMDERDGAEDGVGDVGEGAGGVAEGAEARGGAAGGLGVIELGVDGVEIAVGVEVEEHALVQGARGGVVARRNGIGVERAGVDEAGAGRGQASGGEGGPGGGEFAQGAGARLVVEGPGGDEAGAVGRERLAEGGGDLGGGAGNRPEAHLAGVAGEGIKIGAAVG
jgi:hypothetical protein